MWSSDSAYDSFMGRFSRRLAPLFADFAGVTADDHVLDVGAGTGALTEELLRRGSTVSLAEPSPDFAASLQQRLPDLDVRAAPAEQLPWPDGTFDIALAQLVVAFMSDAWTGVAEMKRVSGGRVAICMWDYHEQQLLASVNHVRERMGGASAEPPRFRTGPELAELIGDGAEFEPLDVVADYEGFEDYWNALLGGAGPAGAWIASLTPERLDEARAEFRHELGDPAGAFQLTGRCWAARSSG